MPSSDKSSKVSLTIQIITAVIGVITIFCTVFQLVNTWKDSKSIAIKDRIDNVASEIKEAQNTWANLKADGKNVDNWTAGLYEARNANWEANNEWNARHWDNATILNEKASFSIEAVLTTMPLMPAGAPPPNFTLLNIIPILIVILILAIIVTVIMVIKIRQRFKLRSKKT